MSWTPTLLPEFCLVQCGNPFRTGSTALISKIPEKLGTPDMVTLSSDRSAVTEVAQDDESVKEPGPRLVKRAAMNRGSVADSGTVTVPQLCQGRRCENMRRRVGRAEAAMYG